MSGKTIISPDAAQAITNLRGNRDWGRVVSWLQTLSSKYQHEQMHAQTGEQALRAGSRAFAYFELMNAIGSAPVVVDELKKGYK